MLLLSVFLRMSALQSQHPFRGECLEYRAVWESIIQTSGSLLNWFNPIPILMGISRETPVSALSRMWGLETEAFRNRQHCNYDDE